MGAWFFIAVGTIALVIVAAAWSVLVAMRSASTGETAVRVHVEPGARDDEVALRITLCAPQSRGRYSVKAIAVEGDLARALALRPPRGFAQYLTGNLRYEEFEPDLDALAARLEEERPRTIDVSRLIEQLQREQFETLQRRREEIAAVQFTGDMLIGTHPLELELPGRPIPEAAGRIWVTTSRRIGAATIEDVVMLELSPEPSTAVGTGIEVCPA